MKQLEAETTKILLNASISFPLEGCQRIKPTMHDDAGPLLATARLVL